jgi:conjugative relaxase-like TrwC/TraI family protein
MKVHKLTAGDGYSYLTRQVAAMDATDKGHTGLGDYYAQKGESPGVWMGSGLAGLEGLQAGQPVSAEQMKALFGEGRHPDAATIEQGSTAAGRSPADALSASSLGRPFNVYASDVPPFRTKSARRFAAYNTQRGLPADSPVPAEDRARIRTQLGREMFTIKHGRPPADARELHGFIAKASRQATTAVAGYDLTFSPVKSISTLWAIAPRQVSEQVEAAHRAAVADTLGWLEREASFTRTGRAGVRQVDVTGLVAAAFTHRDARSGDPDLHTHVAIANKVQTLDGRWFALDGRVLFKATVAASERYNTRIEAELVARLGVRFADRTGAPDGKRVVREIVGVNPALNRFWSARTADIDARRAELSAVFQSELGRPPTPIEALHLNQRANLETRQAKHSPRSLAEERAAWHQEAVTVLGSRDAITAMVGASTGRSEATVTVDERWVANTVGRVLAVVSSGRATWQTWHVRAEAERQARASGVALPDLDAAVARVVARALSPGRSVALGTSDGPAEPTVLQRADGSSVYTVSGSQLYTSETVMAAEAALVAAAQHADGRVVSDSVVDLALLESAANGVTLNPAQAHLVREMATSGARLQLAIAPAGSGKTTAMAVLARGWKDSGGTVIGLAPSAVAASVLREQIGSPTDTLAKLTWSLTHDPMPQWVADIDANTLVVIDEAGMAGTTDLAAAVGYITGKGGAVRLVGDDQQLASVAAGGVLRDIAETAGAVTLSELTRFTDPAEGAASLALRTGDSAGIGFYLDNNRVHVGDQTTAEQDAYRAWATDRSAGFDSIMLAPTRDLVAQLNARARTDRVLASTQPVGREVTLADGNRASAGDTIITRANDRRLVITETDWVKNGDRWTVSQVLPDGAVQAVHLATGRLVTLPTGYVAESAQLGYASTVHGAQGLTTDTSHTVATGSESRQLFYVAMTRGRTNNHVYLVTAGDGDPHSVITPETLLPPTATEILASILARDDRQRSASTLIREQACPTILLREAVARYHDGLGVIAEKVVGADVLDTLDKLAEDLHAGLTASPAYPTLRAHLAIIGADGHDPRTALSTAVLGRELDTAADPAAVLDWRLDPAGGHSSNPGPLPWLPAIPARLKVHEQYGPYLNARVDLIEALVVDVREQANQYAPTTAPPWATHLMDPAHQQLVGDLAVWRAATGVPTQDRRPTGAPQPGAAAARVQHDLDARTAAVQGNPRAAAREWAPLATRLGLDVSHDPYWPELAGHLDLLRRAGLDAADMLTAAAAEKPLPDEQGAAALRWRMSRHLSPAAITATDRTNTRATTEAPALPRAWRELAASIDLRLTTADDWPTLERAIHDADTAGYDIATELPRLAAKGRLATERTATDLAYRLRAASQTTNETEPTIAADQLRLSAGPIARPEEKIRPSPHQPGRPAR